MDLIYATAWMILMALFWAFAIIVALLVIRLSRRRKRRRVEEQKTCVGSAASLSTSGARSGTAHRQIDPYDRQRYDAAAARALDKVGERTRAQVNAHEETLLQMRRRRLVEAESKERVRSALKALSAGGYYVFDEIVTDSAGIADHLAVGPWGACVIVVVDHPDGRVERDAGTNQLLFERRPFSEDPDERGSALVYDILPRAFGEEGPIAYHVCFTSAGSKRGEREDYPEGSCSVWDLSAELCPPRQPEITPDEVALVAQRVRIAYSREPYVRPADSEREI